MSNNGHWFGSVPVIEAISVAWALNFRGQTVRLFFVLPVTARGLLAFVIGFSLLRLIAVQQTPEGLISPFGGLAAGWPSRPRSLPIRSSVILACSGANGASDLTRCATSR